MKRSLLLALMLVLFSVGTAGAQSSDLDARARAVGKELQCPVCQNESVADSPSQLAADMRGVIRQKLQEGQSPEQVKAYFVGLYGEGILLNPPKHGFGLLIWAQPLLVLVLGALILAFALSRWVRGREEAETLPNVTDDELAVYEPMLREELDRCEARRA